MGALLDTSPSTRASQASPAWLGPLSARPGTCFCNASQEQCPASLTAACRPLPVQPHPTSPHTTAASILCRFVQKLRQAAASQPSVTVRQGYVRKLVNGAWH